MNYDVVIIGGGLAGLTAALHLNQSGFQVSVVEKNQYPNHKVCGEYVSNEVKPYLKNLGVDLDNMECPQIDTLQLSTHSGQSITAKLPLGGFGISRYELDAILYQNALVRNIPFFFGTATDIQFLNDNFHITVPGHQKLKAKWVIGAYGKRSILDKKLNRTFMSNKSPWLGVKCHYAYDDFPNNLVALHNFKGGYGGLSKTERGHVNFCYLTTFESFKNYKNVAEFNLKVVSLNPFLGQFLRNASPVFEKPISIAQVSFERKKPVQNHILMCGDSAGLIHPLCGNGMAMAIHAAKIASECIIQSKVQSRDFIEKAYAKRWKKEFRNRLWTGRQLQRLLISEFGANMAIRTVTKSEKLLRSMIRRTHGKPILV
ncbi:NAD(P)/FAD-dependent oxidoreductase [Croceitalea rosinachiae]|uniref:NAD(P)/FAD-dependent oxidoreductase n=1 Tax=Croceitalea rosinachiae TaxID=3075596 RepID=A0ABU3ACN0_9FLAO|nr:NAD(P)/FAD-dependent oxidoreductase [Croceitalea sp. F388]MDT0607635.1 NAD(P)/FAD-dependent oxidoreductase [Croceitalea sp. F388]